MIEYLSDILNGGVSRTPDDACFVIRHDSSNSNNKFCKDNDHGGGEENYNNNNEQTTSTTVLHLSYRQAHEALWQHQCWLAAQEQTGIPLAAAMTNDATSSNTNVVVAYLASNSIDYILSVMACASSPVIMTGACTESSKRHRRRRRHRLLPALLNTRWTADEAVAALLSGNNNDRKNSNNNNKTVVLLLYGPGFEIMATNIVTKLNNNNDDKTAPCCCCCCCCLPIPTFAMQKVLSAGPRLFVQQQEQQQQQCHTINAESSSCVTGVNRHCPVIDPEKEIQRLEDSYYKRRAHSRQPKNNNADNSNIDDNDDTALIVFTSGTTSSSAGSSKGVKLGHISILIQALAKLKAPCLYSTDTVMLLASPSTVPFFHVGGLTSLLAVWLAGGTLLQVENIKQNAHNSHTRNTTNGNGAFDAVVVLQSLQPASMMMMTATQLNGRLEEPTTASPPSSFSSSSSSSCRCYCNTLVLVPAMLHALQQQHSSNQRHVIYPFVKLVLIGGQSASCALLDFARLYFPNARLVQTYACTEAASSITFCNVTTKPSAVAPIITMPTTTTTSTITTSTANGAVDYLSSGDCVGQPPSHIQVALLRIPPPQQDQHDSSSTTTSSRNQQAMIQQPKITSNMMIYQPWQVGVIATRGPHVMNGYWRDNNNDCIDNITCDGWFITNDLGFWGSDKNNDNNKNSNAQQELDLYFCGRTTDTIRTGGETVMALEVERILLQHPSIDQVAVFDVPDEQYGQAVACAIVLAKNDNKNHNHPLLLLDNVRQWCKQHGLAGYKCPRHVFYMTQLPRNSSGKVLKMRLRERFGHSSSQVVTSKL